MKMKRTFETDPEWRRTSNNGKEKKQKMMSRAYQRLQQSIIRKAEADAKKKVKTILCVTRTVELTPAQTIGEEKNKLLFMLALGLVPNSDTSVEANPVIKMERLDPKVEAKALLRKKVLADEIRRKQLKSFRRRRMQLRLSSLGLQPSIHAPLFDISSDDEIEVVNLASSDDDEEITIVYEVCYRS